MFIVTCENLWELHKFYYSSSLHLWYYLEPTWFKYCDCSWHVSPHCPQIASYFVTRLSHQCHLSVVSELFCHPVVLPRRLYVDIMPSCNFVMISCKMHLYIWHYTACWWCGICISPYGVSYCLCSLIKISLLLLCLPEAAEALKSGTVGT